MTDIVEYEQTPAGFTVKTGHPLLGDIHADFQSVGPDYRIGTASALLLSSLLNCWCNTLSAALLARGVEYRSICGKGHVEKEKRDGISRLSRIVLDVRAEVDDDDAEILAHCLGIVRSCMITRSIAEGVEVCVQAERASSDSCS